jgi:hypothetical protein
VLPDDGLLEQLSALRAEDDEAPIQLEAAADGMIPVLLPIGR